MLIVIRNEERLSKKSNFIIQLLNQNSNNKVLHVFRRESEKFRQRRRHDEVQLPSSLTEKQQELIEQLRETGL